MALINHEPATAGDVLRTHRAALRWSQGDLAKASNLTQVTISRIENGATPSARTARKLADALGCDLELLIPTRGPDG